MLTKNTKADEVVCGYRLKERLGSGGYGEVWSADGPGGLTKAVKIVYGYHDEDRAERELKALNRIKQVRHPFLLSLERIEIADGRLIVVTELADKSLKDRFDERLAEGETGMARDELLRFVEDAAEALDYISVTHSLQHLDVKPENLLLASGHIKVADFGLVKEIEEATASMMGGLTPMYAAPELFDGRPSQFSDQYSLAIVYQEMLTAIRPFSGTTTAQLAAQHMQSQPKLSPLPRADQAIIGRALAKDPEQRFESCSEMVEQLLNTTASPVKASPASRKRRSSKDSTDVTTPQARAVQPTDPGPPQNRGKQKGTESLPRVRGLGALPKAATAVTSLPTLPWNPEDRRRLYPTLLVGVGQIASRTVAKVNGRLRDRFGDAKTTPSVRALCLDTNRRSLLELTRGEKGISLHHDETLEMPLRTPEEYRFGSAKHLSWLSRRWLYNIPRTLSTEGIRPLGRLAFADHTAELFEKLSDTIGDMVEPDAIAATSQATGLPAGDGRFRVFILASTSGGTGSGMVLDVAYAVRKTLADLGLPDTDICGILMHCSHHAGSQRDLAIANTCACLSELYYYSGVNGYPGDESCGLPRCQDNRATFSETYLLHLGEDLPKDELETVTDSVAEYVYLNSVTKCAATFDTGRELTGKTCDYNSPDNFALRTFGLSQIAFSRGEVADRVVGFLCHKVIKRWLGEEQDAARSRGDGNTQKRKHATLDPESLVEELVKRLGLTTEQLSEQVLAIVRQACGGDIESYLASIVGESAQDGENPRSRSVVSRALERLEDFFGYTNPDDEVDPEIARFQITVEKRLKVIGQRTAKELLDAVMAIVDDPTTRLRGAFSALDNLRGVAAQLVDDGNQRRAEMLDELRVMQNDLLSPPAQKRRGVAGLLRRETTAPATCSEQKRMQKFSRLRIEAYAWDHLLAMLAKTQEQLGDVGTKLSEMKLTLDGFSQQLYDPKTTKEEFHVLVDEDDLEEQNRYLTGIVSKSLSSQTPRIAERLDENFQMGHLAQSGGLHSILSSASKERRELPELIHARARAAVLSALNETDLVQIILDSELNESQTMAILNNRLERATPMILQCGGAKRLMLALPELPSSETFTRIITEELKEEPTVAQRPEGSLVLCYEAEQIPLSNVVRALLENRPERAKYAARLHTRVDVNWPPMTGNE